MQTLRTQTVLPAKRRTAQTRSPPRLDQRATANLIQGKSRRGKLRLVGHTASKRHVLRRSFGER